MDDSKYPRRTYTNSRQKKRLIQFITKHPEMITAKVTDNCTKQDLQALWQTIAKECNSMPSGAQKTWRQWRKTWHDLRSKVKKRQTEMNGHIPPSATMLTPAEREVLGLKNASSPDEQDTTEFISFDQDDEDNNALEIEYLASLSEPESPPEVKVFSKKEIHKSTKIKTKINNSSSDHSANCSFNCDLLAVNEQKKIKIKEEYLNFKKDYLRQKLKLMKEQTEALKTIARELSDQ